MSTLSGVGRGFDSPHDHLGIGLSIAQEVDLLEIAVNSVAHTSSEMVGGRFIVIFVFFFGGLSIVIIVFCNADGDGHSQKRKSQKVHGEAHTV